MMLGRHIDVHLEPAVIEHWLINMCGCCMLMRPMGRIGSIFSENRPANFDKLRLRTPAPLDAAMVLGRHLYIYQEPVVFE